MGFESTPMEFIRLPDGRLLVVYKAEYKVQSGNPPDQDHVEFFVHEKHETHDTESAAANKKL